MKCSLCHRDGSVIRVGDWLVCGYCRSNNTLQEAITAAEHSRWLQAELLRLEAQHLVDVEKARQAKAPQRGPPSSFSAPLWKHFLPRPRGHTASLVGRDPWLHY